MNLHRISEKTLSEWLTIFEGASFPYGPINNIEGVFSDPQVGGAVYVFMAVMLSHDITTDNWNIRSTVLTEWYP